MQHPTRTLLISLALLIAVSSISCQAPQAHDPAKQAGINSRQALLDVETSYAALERQIVTMRKANVISGQVEMELVAELHGSVRPLIDLAKQMQYAPQAGQTPQDFNNVLLKAGKSLGEVGAKIPAPSSILTPTPTTQVISPQHGQH